MARTYSNLYPHLITFDNLYLAYQKAARGKRGRCPVAEFEWRLESNLLHLQRELETYSYCHGDYHSFYIHDPKRRLVSAAPFRDRVVHHALCNVIEPIFERTFIGDSYANRLGKGTHHALSQAKSFSRRFPYVLQCDIRKFFPSIDHEILKGIIARKILDESVMWLGGQILSGGEGVLVSEYEQAYFPGDDLLAACRPRGLPIGNLTSQFWANVYLNELDQFVKRRLRCRAYLRYMDDFLLFSDNKRQLWRWKKELQGFLAQLRLNLHERESTVYPVSNGIPFLGFRLYPTHMRLKRRNGVAFVRRLRRYYRAYSRNQITREELDYRVKGWIAHAEHGDTWGLRRALLGKPLPIREYP